MTVHLDFMHGLVGDYPFSSIARPTPAAAGVCDLRAITALWQKCRAGRDLGPLSYPDNMALVGVVSTPVLHGAFVAKSPSEDHRGLVPRAVIDLVPPP